MSTDLLHVVLQNLPLRKNHRFKYAPYSRREVSATIFPGQGETVNVDKSLQISSLHSCICLISNSFGRSVERAILLIFVFDYSKSMVDIL